MRTQIDRHNPADAILAAGEGDTAFDAWTLEELDDDLGSLREVLSSDDAAG